MMDSTPTTTEVLQSPLLASATTKMTAEVKKMEKALAGTGISLENLDDSTRTATTNATTVTTPTQPPPEPPQLINPSVVSCRKERTRLFDELGEEKKESYPMAETSASVLSSTNEYLPYHYHNHQEEQQQQQQPHRNLQGAAHLDSDGNEPKSTNGGGGDNNPYFMPNIVDGPFCHGMWPATYSEDPCGGVNILPTCQASIENQLDLFTHCRQPLAFLSFFREHHTHDAVGVEVLPSGAYVVPAFCEYCGASSTSLCNRPGNPPCQRPKLYFQKKRPPFCKPNPMYWEPLSDIAVDKNKLAMEYGDSQVSGLQQHRYAAGSGGRKSLDGEQKERFGKPTRQQQGGPNGGENDPNYSTRSSDNNTWQTKYFQQKRKDMKKKSAKSQSSGFSDGWMSNLLFGGTVDGSTGNRTKK